MPGSKGATVAGTGPSSPSCGGGGGGSLAAAFNAAFFSSTSSGGGGGGGSFGGGGGASFPGGGSPGGGPGGGPGGRGAATGGVGMPMRGMLFPYIPYMPYICGHTNNQAYHTPPSEKLTITVPKKYTMARFIRLDNNS